MATTWQELKSVINDVRRESSQSFISDAESLRYANLIVSQIASAYPWSFTERTDGGFKIASQTVIGNITKSLPEDFKIAISVNGNLATSATSTPFEFDYLRTRDYNLLISGYFYNIVGNNIQLFFPQGNVVATSSITGVDQSQTSDDSDVVIGESGGNQVIQAQSFVAQKPFLNEITIRKGTTVGAPTGNIKVEIRKNDNSGSNKVPDSTIVAEGTIAKATWDTAGVGTDLSITLASPVQVFTPGRYWIVVLSTDTEGAGNNYAIRSNTAGGYVYGNRAESTDAEATWTQSTDDLYFITTYVERDLALSYFSKYIVVDEDGITLKSKIEKDGDTFLIDDRYVEAIIQGALKFVFQKEGKTQDVAYAETRYKEILDQMVMDEPNKAYQPLRQFRHYMNGY